MRAWTVRHQGPATGSIAMTERPPPQPSDGELLVRVLTCGVCRTDLHVVEGDLPVHLPGVTPGHEVVGVVAAAPPGSGFTSGDRVGVPWLRSTCGMCRFCMRGEENLCLSPRFTGWDAHGGYAEYCTVDAAYAYRIPERFTDVEAAPLLCAGIIGFRALRRAALPPGGALGIWGFGGSAHIAAQVAMWEGGRVHVRTRAASARELAAQLGAASVGDSADPLAEPLDAAILFAPAGDLVPTALAALDRGATLAVAGIHLTAIPPLDYQHHLFQERRLLSVTANTRADGREFLRIADEMRLRPTTMDYDFDDADLALRDLAADMVNGAAVLHVGT